MRSLSGALFDRSPSVLAGVYLAVGALAVPIVDLVFGAVDGTAGLVDVDRLLGGWTVFGVSSLFLYGAVSHHSRRAAAAREELETSNQQLQVLSRVFRHNVRNDLNVVQGYADLLERRLDDERSRECLDVIRETTEEVVEMSEKIRIIEDASNAPADERTDLVGVLGDAVAEVDDDVAVSVDAPETAWIRANESVRYPVREVVENAVAHNSDPNRRVVARIDVDDDGTQLSVTDNGPGIPEDERAVLRAEEETPLSHASSIGLWLVKWMCELQGGSVAFDASDDGTTVRLRFQTANGAEKEPQAGR